MRILAFYRDAGVDAALGEAGVDRFAESARETRRAADAATARAGGPEPAHMGMPSPSVESEAPSRAGAGRDMREAGSGRPAPAPPPAPSLPAPPVLAQPDEAAMAAREAAREASSLDELRAILERFEGCALKRTASRLVFADGNPEARVMFVGEAPGRDEDREGLPFVGRSGRLLDLMMGAIGLDRTSAYIANIIPWRPPGNRTPTPQETAICLPFIARQIELMDPDVLVCLGGPSAQALLATTEGITKLRGRVLAYETGTRAIKALATFHPAYLLRTPVGKRLAWRDMLTVEALLAGA